MLSVELEVFVEVKALIGCAPMPESSKPRKSVKQMTLVELLAESKRLR